MKLCFNEATTIGNSTSEQDLISVSAWDTI